MICPDGSQHRTQREWWQIGHGNGVHAVFLLDQTVLLRSVRSTYISHTDTMPSVRSFFEVGAPHPEAQLSIQRSAFNTQCERFVAFATFWSAARRYSNDRYTYIPHREKRVTEARRWQKVDSACVCGLRINAVLRAHNHIPISECKVCVYVKRNTDQEGGLHLIESLFRRSACDFSDGTCACITSLSPAFVSVSNCYHTAVLPYPTTKSRFVQCPTQLDVVPGDA